MDIKWYYLPPLVDGAAMISLSLQDRIKHRKDYLFFTLPPEGTSYVVFLIFDSRLPVLPDWVASDGFARIRAKAVARQAPLSHFASPTDVTFDMLGKRFPAGTTVRLGGAQSFDENLLSMYCVCVVPLHTILTQHPQVASELAFQIALNMPDKNATGQEALPDSTLLTKAQCAWVNGSNGYSLFQAKNNTVQIALR